MNEQTSRRVAPAFQLYTDDFIAGTADMAPEEVGAYIRLLCYQWNRGSIPVEPERQQRLAGGCVSVAVRSKFPPGPDGLLRNERLERVRASADAFRQKQAEKGRISAEKRKQANRGTNRGSTAVATVVQPLHQPEGQPEGNSPSPSPKCIIAPSVDGTQGRQDLPRKPKASRERNPLLDAIVEVTGGDPAQTTPIAWSQAAKALSEIRVVCPDVTPEEIRARAKFHEEHNNWTLTPLALAKHWGGLGARNAQSSSGGSGQGAGAFLSAMSQAKAKFEDYKRKLVEYQEAAGYAIGNPNHPRYPGEALSASNRQIYEGSLAGYRKFYALVKDTAPAVGMADFDMAPYELERIYEKMRSGAAIDEGQKA